MLSSLPTPDILQAVMLGAGQRLQRLKVKTVVDLSTSGPKAAAAVAEGLARSRSPGWTAPSPGGVKAPRPAPWR